MEGGDALSAAAAKIKRPVLRYLGGKWRLAPWICQQLPPHRIYVEPFGGAASVLMQKPRAYAEVYNDLAGDIVHVFRVLRDPELAAKLRAAIRLTPYAREEFESAYDEVNEPIERARRVIFRSFAGFGSGSAQAVKCEGMRTRASTWRTPTGFRADSRKSGSTPAHDWSRYPDSIEAFTQRLRGVVIESRPALQVMRDHDRADTLFYVDPPYLLSVRNRVKSTSGRYTFEMSESDHSALLEALQSLKGMVLLSGYPSPLYSEALPTWTEMRKATFADGARSRTEALWLNPDAAERAQQKAMAFK